eukprot:11265.XXX_310804_311703_1 [CDS] Oithona nana genome sequencing.
MKTFLLLCACFVALKASEIPLEVTKIHRNLLQEYSDEVSDDTTEKDEEAVKEEEKPIVYKGLATPGEAELGPRLFYDGKDFLMKLGAPIRVTIYSGESDEKLSTVDLDGKAVSVKGGMIDQDNFKVNLDWKSQNFGNDFKISTIQIHMYFAKTKDEFVMNKLEVVGFKINAKQIHLNSLDVKSKHGYKVSAPLGSSFCCYNPGLFAPRPSSTSNEFKVGLTFPDMQLQVFRLAKENRPPRFGPEWACDSFMPIGLLVGLLLSLLFAVICFYGFSMLASIQTMDRFDDPRGKTIHIPQTD